MGLHIGRDGIKGGYTMRVLGAIANHSSPLPRDFLPPILGGATCHKFILFLYFERKIFVKSTMRSLKYLSSNMFANFNCVRKESRKCNTWGIRISGGSDRSLDDNEKLDEDKLSERAECSICEQVSALNFPALGQAFRSFPQRQADNKSGEPSHRCPFLPLLDICNGTRFKNRWIGFFASAHFRSYSILPRRKKNKRGCKYPRGRIHR